MGENESALDKAKLAHVEINALIKLNPHYIQVYEVHEASLLIEFHGLEQNKGWFCTQKEGQNENLARFKMVYLELEELPIVYFLNFPPFHPNIDSENLEFNNLLPMLQSSVLKASTNASHLVAFMWGLLSYQIIDLNHVKNRKAAKWYSEHKSSLPLTNIALQIPTPTSGFRIKTYDKNLDYIQPQSSLVLNESKMLERRLERGMDDKQQPQQGEKATPPIEKNILQNTPVFKVKKIQQFIPKKKAFQLTTTNSVIWHAPVVTIRQSALNKILLHGSSDTNNEQFGILIGCVYEDPDNSGNWLEIIDMVPAKRHKGSAVYVEVSAEEVAEMTRISEPILEQHPDACRLGWYHTHPGHKIFMSSTDKNNHRNVYRAPWQVAMVYDPCNNLFGLFSGLQCWSIPENNIFIISDEVPTIKVATPKYQEMNAYWNKNIKPNNQTAQTPDLLKTVQDSNKPLNPVFDQKPIPLSNRLSFSKIARGALLIGLFSCIFYLGYLLGKAQPEEIHDETLQPTAIVENQTKQEKRQWASEQQSKIFSNVLSQVSEGDIDELDRARLIGQLEVVIALDKTSTVALDAKKMIDILEKESTAPPINLDLNMSDETPVNATHTALPTISPTLDLVPSPTNNDGTPTAFP